jgi:tetratricopeptide (TPR) repeat protein
MNLESTFGSSPHSVEAMISGLSATFTSETQGDVFPVPKSAYNFSAARGGSKSVSHTHLSTNEIIEHLKRGDRLDPNDADSYLPLAQAHIQLGNWNEAIRVSTAAADLFSTGDEQQRETKMAVAYFFRGYSHASLARKLEREEKLRNLQLSESDFREAIRLNEDFVSAYCYLGVLLATQNRWDEAEKALKQAIKIKPDYVGAHNDLGAMYLMSERPHLAVRQLKKALGLRPDDHIVLRNLGEAYWQLGRWRDAQAVYRRAIKVTPDDATAYFLLGTLYAAQGSWQKAAEALKIATQLKQDYADAYGNLGAVYFKLGRVHDAVFALSRALEIEPDDAAARNSLDEIRRRMLEGVIRAQFEGPKHKSAIDFESLVSQLAEAGEHIFGKQRHADPFEDYTPDDILSAFISIEKRISPESRLALAAKFLGRGLLSSGKAAQLAGLDRVTFLKKLERAGGHVPSIGRKESEPAPINADAAVSLLQSWNAGDPREQRETWKYLKAALDEDRLSDRKLFR